MKTWINVVLCWLILHYIDLNFIFLFFCNRVVYHIFLISRKRNACLFILCWKTFYFFTVEMLSITCQCVSVHIYMYIFIKIYIQICCPLTLAYIFKCRLRRYIQTCSMNETVSFGTFENMIFILFYFLHYSFLTSLYNLRVFSRTKEWILCHTAFYSSIFNLYPLGRTYSTKKMLF